MESLEEIELLGQKKKKKPGFLISNELCFNFLVKKSKIEKSLFHFSP